MTPDQAAEIVKLTEQIRNGVVIGAICLAWVVLWLLFVGWPALKDIHTEVWKANQP